MQVLIELKLTICRDRHGQIRLQVLRQCNNDWRFFCDCLAYIALALQERFPTNGVKDRRYIGLYPINCIF